MWRRRLRAMMEKLLIAGRQRRKEGVKKKVGFNEYKKTKPTTPAQKGQRKVGVPKAVEPGQILNLRGSLVISILVFAQPRNVAELAAPATLAIANRGAPTRPRLFFRTTTCIHVPARLGPCSA
jgi:hypothetical protein